MILITYWASHNLCTLIIQYSTAVANKTSLIAHIYHILKCASKMTTLLSIYSITSSIHIITLYQCFFTLLNHAYCIILLSTRSSLVSSLVDSVLFLSTHCSRYLSSKTKLFINPITTYHPVTIMPTLTPVSGSMVFGSRQYRAL